MSEVIRLYEVGPRDGLQNLEGDITTENKANLVELLLDAGLDRIEIGSFVNPKHVPQTGEIMRHSEKFRNIRNIRNTKNTEEH